jgi:ABC-type lipoprotein export system ATPase subunit
MVTHEPDIAAFARRDVVMRDGVMRSDRAVSQRLIASDEIGKRAGVDELPQPEN